MCQLLSQSCFMYFVRLDRLLLGNLPHISCPFRSQQKSSGASQLCLRQTPHPRTIFQAGQSPNSNGKPRRQNRKQDQGLLQVRSVIKQGFFSAYIWHLPFLIMTPWNLGRSCCSLGAVRFVDFIMLPVWSWFDLREPSGQIIHLDLIP